MVSLPAIEELLMRAYTRADDRGPCLAVVATPDDNHPELALFTIRPMERAAANKTIHDAGLSGLNNIRTVRDIVKIPLLGTGKADYRALLHMLAAAA